MAMFQKAGLSLIANGTQASNGEESRDLWDTGDLDSEALFKFGLYTARMVTWDWNLRTNYVWRSSNAVEVVGFAEGSSAHFNDLVHPDDRERVSAAIEKAKCTDAPYDEEFRIVTPDGRTLWVANKAKRRIDSDGVPHLTGVWRDITLQKNAEEALRQSEERFRALVESASQVVWEANADGVVLKESWLEHKGQRAEEFSGRSCLSAVHPDDRELAQRIWQHSITTGEKLSAELRLLGPNGGWRWAQVHAAPIRDARGRTVKWAGMNIDVTERKLAEELLRQSEERFHTAARVTNDVIWEWNIVTGGVWWNEAMQSMFGYSADDVGSDFAWWYERIHPQDREEVYASVQTLTEKQETFWSKEYRFLRANGEYAEVFDRGYLIRDGAGKTVRMLGAMQDVTVRKQAEKVLKEADRRKDAFLAMLGHELRNPLAPVLNALEILNHPGTADTLQFARDVIERQTKHMVRLIDDLLDVSRIAQGKLIVRRERTTLKDIVDDALEIARPHIKHNLSVSLPQETVHIEVDRTRLAQVVANLMHNACKYTPQGGHIHLAAEHDAGGIVLKVSDDGAGIPQSDIARVFDMFEQVESTLSEAQGGLGIGLSLVKGLVELHGGTVHAVSEGVGKGSEFIVRLPVLTDAPVPALEPSTRVQASPRAPARRILVVDDNDDTTKSLSVLLSLDGNQVETANDGLEAVAKANIFKPDVVLLDIGLPNANGYEACQAIRAQPWAKSTLIVALSGWGQQKDHRRSSEAGFDKHLVKPVDYSTLVSMVGERGNRVYSPQ